MAGKKILIVATRTAGGRHLVDKIKERMQAGPCEFVLLSPASRPEHGMVWDEESAREGAEERLATALERLRAVGAKVQGRIGALGEFHPMGAIENAMREEHFDEIIISTLSQGVSEWLKMDLVNRVRRKFDVPVEHIVSHE